MDVDAARLNFEGNSLWVVNGLLALIMFGVALDLAPRDFGHVLRAPKPVFVGFLAQYLFLPCVTFLLVLLLRPAPSIALGMMLVSACPGGNLSNFLTHMARGNTALSISLTAISTLAAVIMTPLLVTLPARLYADAGALLHEIQIDPPGMALMVFVLLGLPLAAGMTCKRGFPALSARLEKPFKLFSVVFLLAFAAFLFLNNMEVFTGYIHWVALAVFAHNALGLLTGYAAARTARLAPRDVRAVTIETGIRNSTVGLVLVFTFFDGLGGMALVAATWGIWHLIAGLLLAAFWSRTPIRNDAETAPNPETAT